MKQTEPLAIRALTGISQQEAAYMMGISREAVALYESGRRPGLPANGSLFHNLLQLEMAKPENQQAPQPMGDNTRKKLIQTLDLQARESRYQAESLLMQIQRCTEKLRQQQGKMMLVPCLEKVHASLQELSGNSTWQPLGGLQKNWLERVKQAEDFTQPDEATMMKQKLLELQYHTRLKEAEEAERMLAELRGNG